MTAGRRPRSSRPVGLAVLTALLCLTAARSPEARESRVVAIAGHEMTVALPDGDCFFDPQTPADGRLIDDLSSAAGDRFVMLLAFADCRTIEGWRTGAPATMPRFGYVMIAQAHLESVFAFDQAALAQAIGKALADEGTVDYKADIARLAGDLERVWPQLPPAGSRQLGILHRDRFGPVLATAASVAGAGTTRFPRVMLHQSILASGKVITVVAARDYRNSETIFDAYGDLSALAEATASRN